MKNKNVKKKIGITGLTLAMMITNAPFHMLRIHGESNLKEIVPKDIVRNTITTPKKAIFTNTGTLTGRTDVDVSDGVVITDLATITDLMIDDQVTNVPAGKFEGLENITTLTFKAAVVESTAGGGTSRVTSIGERAFKGTGITSVVLPKGLITIESSAFANTAALTNVDFTNSTNLANMKTSAFENSGLTAVDLSPMNASTAASLKVGIKAFKGNSSLARVTLSTKMTEIGTEVFASTNITTIEIVENIAKIDPLAFEGTPLATLTVNAANTSFSAEDNVLYNTEKTRLVLYPEGKTDAEFTLSDTLTHIEEGAFNASPTLTNVITGTGLVSIGDYAFDGAAKLVAIELKDSLTHIGQFAFNRSALATIALPANMTGIEANAFAGAAKLTKLDLRKAAAIKTVKANAFKGSALNTMVISKNTGPLDTITVRAFDSLAQTRRILFMDDTDTPIIGNDFTTLKAKYDILEVTDNGGWTFDVKHTTPTASVDYEAMKIVGLEPSAGYTIGGEEYTSDANGKVELLKKWGGNSISIVRNAANGQNASDAQSLTVDGIYTLTVDGIAKGLKRVGASVTLSAPAKEGHVFTNWVTTDVTFADTGQKTITFNMPAKDVTLTTQYTEIVVETPVSELIFDGKTDVAVTIASAVTNFVKIAANGRDLVNHTEYTVSGTGTMLITLKQAYLDTLVNTTQFTVTFTEGGNKKFSVRLFGTAPAVIAEYNDMNLSGFEANANYKINGNVVTADEQGKIKIKKTWGDQTLEIIKVGTGTETDSKPQNLKIKAFYTVVVNGKEVAYGIEGQAITVQAEHKEGYKLKEWIAKGVTLTDASKEEITFEIPANDVELETTYTKIMITKPEDMIYDGTKEVAVRFDIPMAEFQDIEYEGKKLVKNVDYTVTSGSTIITFTKTFLEQMKGDIREIKAVFTRNSVEFSIQYAVVPPIVDPMPTPPPVVNPTPPLLPISPLPETKAPEKTSTPEYVEKVSTNSPSTGDSTNMYVIIASMIASAGVFVGINKKKKAVRKE